MIASEKSYLPAAGYDFFLPLYDPLTKLAGVDKLRRALMDQAELAAGQRVLDVGCGTGTLLVFVKDQHPDVDAVGVDPDPKALERARRKARRAGVDVQFDQGYANALSYPDASFDRVLSSLMFHHLESDDRNEAMRELRRVLRPGGRLELVDLAGRSAGGNRLHRWLHSHPRMEDEQSLLALMSEAGFARPRIVERRTAFFGTAVFYQALLG